MSDKCICGDPYCPPKLHFRHKQYFSGEKVTLTDPAFDQIGSVSASAGEASPSPGRSEAQEKNSLNVLTSSAPQEEKELGLIPLNFEQQKAVTDWAADDRLWTTQDTVAINLATFARVILKLTPLRSAPPHEEKLDPAKDPK